MFISCFPSGPFDTNAYIVTCPITGVSALIDPAVDSFKSVEVEKLDKILITHSHWDHIGDTVSFKEKYQSPIYIHPLDAPNLESPGIDKLPCWISISGIKPDVFIGDGDLIEVGKLVFRVIHTPGHSPGGVCFYCKEENVLFSGDTLFRGSIGNLSFPTAEPQKMWESLERLSKLPPETVVYPGHGPKTILSRESWLPRAKELFSS